MRAPRVTLVRVGVVVEVSAQQFSIPVACTCCGDPDPGGTYVASYTRRTGKRVIREQTRSLRFHYCLRCIDHVSVWRNAAVVLQVFLALGLLVGIAVAANAGVGEPGLIAGFATAFPGLPFFILWRMRASSRRCPSCACTGHAVSHLGWDGSVSAFKFESVSFGVAFAEANGRKLINVGPYLRRLLQANAEAAHQPAPRRPPPPPRAPQRVPNDFVTDWIAKIESYKGPVARRNALHKALSEVGNDHDRRTLVLAASKIEVTAVMEKVDSLTSDAAKRRHLEKAIDDVHRDPIPDELQAEELRILHERLAQLR